VKIFEFTGSESPSPKGGEQEDDVLFFIIFANNFFCNACKKSNVAVYYERNEA